MSVHRGKQVPFAVWCAGWLSDGQRHFGQASCHPVFTIRCSDESVGVIHSTLDLSFGNASGKVFTRRLSHGDGRRHVTADRAIPQGFPISITRIFDAGAPQVLSPDCTWKHVYSS